MNAIWNKIWNQSLNEICLEMADTLGQEIVENSIELLTWNKRVKHWILKHFSTRLSTFSTIRNTVRWIGCCSLCSDRMPHLRPPCVYYTSPKVSPDSHTFYLDPYFQLYQFSNRSPFPYLAIHFVLRTLDIGTNFSFPLISTDATRFFRAGGRDPREDCGRRLTSFVSRVWPGGSRRSACSISNDNRKTQRFQAIPPVSSGSMQISFENFV